ncbi:MAG: hypothetical protein D6805_04365 [Planctomycetota bacterium]|nr:MAG: hypothetical protein D6805_04365 [Planctomycetota bacterium]
MKRLFFLCMVLSCFGGFLGAQEKVYTVEIGKLLQEHRAYHGKVVQVIGFISSKGTMDYGNGKGYHYYVLSSKDGSIQVRVPLSRKRQPSLNDKVEVVAKVVSTKYGPYLEERSFRITGRRKIEVRPLGLDPKVAKRLRQLAQLMQVLQKARGLAQNLRKAMKSLGISPEDVQRFLYKLRLFLKDMGVEEKSLGRLLKSAEEFWRELQVILKQLERNVRPLIRELQRQMGRILQRRLKGRQVGGG